MAKRIVDEFPNEIRVVEHLWIELADGARLAARLWLPADAERRPVPAIIEYMPYRRRDLLRLRDQPIHHYFAGHGYAALRVDLRGSGDSDGVLTDMWTEAEIDDGQEVIAWVARQPWCTGAVGMIGKSWSGFSALQAAARAPAALKAIITVCSAEDRYTTTLHYSGGAVLTDSVWWCSSMLLFCAMPPDPETVGAGWRATWSARLAANRPMLADWLNHPYRDGYWREGSVGPRLGAIGCAVYAVGGWADYLSRGVPRMLAGIKAPCRGLIGPWGHHYPQDGTPGPAIGFLQDAVRWWDRWLKGERNGIDAEPVLRAWMQESVAPAADCAERPGRWVAERAWPAKRIALRRWTLNDRSLDRRPKAPVVLVHRSPQTVGLCATEWLAAGVPGEYARDQREDDGRSLCFDTAALASPVEILGEALAELRLAVDRPVATIIARLCDVAPDGTSLRVAFAVLNLAHREGHEAPRPMARGEPSDVVVRLPAIAHAFPAGHRIRLALSTCYWPIVWPSPEPVTLTLFGGASRFALPVRPRDARDAALPAFGAPEQAPDVKVTRLESSTLRRAIERDPRTGHVAVTLHAEGGVLGPHRRYRIDDIDTEMAHTIRKRLDIDDHDPLSARAELVQTMAMGRPGWRVGIQVRTVLTCDRTHFHVEAELRATLEGEEISARQWKSAHPRLLV
jgi:uncharacterized protein